MTRATSRSLIRRVTRRSWPAVRPGDTLSCPEVGRVLQRFLDDELSDPGWADALAAHLDECRRCGLEADTYRRIKASLVGRREPVPPESVERLRAFGERLARGG